jgi:hypothetical protein
MAEQVSLMGTLFTRADSESQATLKFMKIALERYTNATTDVDMCMITTAVGEEAHVTPVHVPIHAQEETASMTTASVSIPTTDIDMCMDNSTHSDHHDSHVHAILEADLKNLRVSPNVVQQQKHGWIWLRTAIEHHQHTEAVSAHMSSGYSRASKVRSAMYALAKGARLERREYESESVNVRVVEWGHFGGSFRRETVDVSPVSEVYVSIVFMSVYRNCM